uniref:PARP catalytic domain-containing protein n=1 Tax=Mycena chlorophos TaxID=658473 RepID=A0ABQ0KX91_MYCCL|nr:predicted protein [Mycena chlorophos]
MDLSDDDEIVLLDEPPSLKSNSRQTPAKRRTAASTSPRKRPNRGETIEIFDSDDERPPPSRTPITPIRPPKSLPTNTPSFIDLTEDDVPPPRKDKGKGKATAVALRRPLTVLENLESDSDVDENDPIMRDVGRLRRRRIEEKESLDRAAKMNPKQQKADEKLARKLQAQEDKQLKNLVASVEKKTEGIVFRVAVDIATGLLEDGTPAHEDDLARFEPWKKKFEAANVKIKKYHWIVNYELEKKFEAARETLRGIIGEEPPEIELFHGTADRNIDLILDGGFKIGGVGGHPLTNGHSLGRGIYLAEDPAMSVGYCVGGYRMFACRVLPGRPTGAMNYSQQLPKAAVGSGEFESYNGSPGVHVVRHVDLVLPCFMVEFEPPYYNNYFGLWGFGALGLPAPAAIPPLPPMPAVLAGMPAFPAVPPLMKSERG